MSYKMYEEKNGRMPKIYQDFVTDDYDEACVYFAGIIIKNILASGVGFIFLKEEEDGVQTGWYENEEHLLVFNADEEIDWVKSDLVYIGNEIDGFDRFSHDVTSWYMLNE